MGCKTEYIALQESKSLDNTLISLVEDAPEFPEFMLTPTDLGTWEVSLQGIKSLIEFKIDKYPKYINSVDAILQALGGSNE